MKEELVTYVGLADAHGIEVIRAFNEDEPVAAHCYYRAASNRQRHAVAFFVDLTNQQFKTVTKSIKSSQYQKALKQVKKYANVNNSLDLVSEGMGNVMGSWNLIPNPALDPWRF